MNDNLNNQVPNVQPQQVPNVQPQQVPPIQPQQVAPVQQPVTAPQAVAPKPQVNNIEQQLEELRQKAVKKQNTFIIIAVSIVAVLLVYTLSSNGSIELVLYGGMFIAIITGIICATLKEKKEFVNSYKQNIVVATLNQIFSDVHFDLERGIPEQVIRDTDMMMMGNIYSSNDYFYGKYKDILFECSDVLIQQETTDSDGDTHTTTYFNGQWYIFQFNKRFKGSFQVCEKSFHYAKRQGGLFSKNKDEKIEMEDQEFNKLFKVFGSDAHSVFYVLTPNTMEKIKQINNEIPGSLLFCFKDDRLHVGVYNGKDLFEPKLRKPVNIANDTQSTRKEIDAILRFVDILNLDNDLFM